MKKNKIFSLILALVMVLSVGMVSFAGMAAYFSLMLVQGGLNVVFDLLRSLVYAL